MSAANPADWSTVRLGEVGQSLIGLTYSPGNVKRSGTLVLRSSNIQDGALAFENNVYVDSDIPDKIRVLENDVLICVRNGSRRLIGKSVILDKRVVGQTFGAFMAVYRSDANPFLQYFFQSDDFKNQIDAHLGATINQITNGSLNSFVVALPPKDEQNAIAARLKDADQLIATLQRLIAKKQAIKQGMMQQLLTGRTRLPGFSGDWPIVPLFDLVDIRNGQVDPRDETYRNMTLVAPDQVEAGTGRMLFRASAADQRAISGKYLVDVGDIIYGKINPHLKKVARATEASLCSADMYPLSPRPGVDGGYVFYHLLGDNFTNFAVSLSRRSGIPKINREGLRGYTMPLPGQKEQRAISSALGAIDAQIETLRTRLTKARAVKVGMMQQLLTGRVRLPMEASS
ncbi:restriction endonuclease subunit S [Brevibacterium linens]|uniref:restriction endonuclease subunit S n=1 Tax=Brevibacterium linens TaxID=1703 RepID=UPI0035139C18